MDVSELMRIVRAEGLEPPVLYGVGDFQAEVVVLEKDGSDWKVFVANERGGVMGSTLEKFDNESDALERVLQKIRQGAKYHRALQERNGGTRVTHEDLTADDVLDLVDELRPVSTQARKKSAGELGFVIYDAFSVRGSYDDYGRGNWGFSIILGSDASVSSVFGRRLTICSTRDEVRAALKAIDRYARLRLGSEYLAAYERGTTNG